MGIRLDNAIGLYLEGIRDGRPREAVDKYTGGRYTQHNTHVRDGRDDFIEFFEDFQKRYPERDIRILRAFEAGRLLFVHSHQFLNKGESQWLTMDIFDTDAEGKIVEHCDALCAYQEKSGSGRGLIDGPTEISDLEHTAANKARVRLFLAEVLQNGDYDAVKKHVASGLKEHSPGMHDGAGSLARFLRTARDRGEPLVYDFVFKLLGCGNFVASFSKALAGEKELAAMDLFRLEAGLIAEHWSVSEDIPPREDWVNCGKF